jgi:hypothetical protein
MAKVSANGQRKVVARRITRLYEKYRPKFVKTPKQNWDKLLNDRYLSCEHKKAIELACSGL